MKTKGGFSPIKNEIVDPTRLMSRSQRTQVSGYLKENYPKVKYRVEVFPNGKTILVRCIPHKWPGKFIVFRWPSFKGSRTDVLK